jgi:hypothetical protein
MYCFEAGLLVDSGPYHILPFRSLLVEGKESHSETHSSCQGQGQDFLDELIVELMEGANSEILGKLQHETASCCLGLVGHNVSASPDPMTHMVVPLFDHSRKNPRFPLSDPHFMVKIVAVHQSKGIEDVPDGEIV